MSFANMKISSRLVLIAVIAVVGVVAATMITYFKLASDIRAAEIYKTNVITRQELLAKINGQLGYGGMIHRFKNIVIRGNSSYKDKFYENYNTLKQLTETLAAQPGVTDNEKQALATLTKTVEQYKSGADKAYEMWQTDMAISEIDKSLKVDDSPALAAIDAISEANRAYTETATKLQTEIISSGFRVVIAMFALIAATIVALLYVTYRALSRQLGGEPTYAAAIVGKIAEGDVTVAIETQAKDRSSLLFAITAMRDNLANVVSKVRAGADAIATASSQIASGNLDLSSRTEEQASSLEETAASMKELTLTVKQNDDSARQANQLARSASDAAIKGGAVIAQMVNTMGSINASSKRIVDIISVIDGIAFQTNILALNAAVEAARAGEQGRGFAVVATEVRSLAQRSAAAAKEIKTLIGDSVDRVDAGSALVEHAGSTMEQIVVSIQRVTDIMGEIAAASTEQTSGIEQINQAISQMDHVTQQNAALVEEATAATESLQNQAGNLVHVVSVFKLDAPPTLLSASVLGRTNEIAHPDANATTHLRNARIMPFARKQNLPRIAADHAECGQNGKGAGVQRGGGDEWEQFLFPRQVTPR